MKSPASTLFIFPGQGSQAPGMAAGWQSSGAARLVLEEACEILNYNLGAIMAASADAATLTQTQYAQPALLVVGLMAVAALQEATGKPLTTWGAGVAGHSLGEYTAVAAAGGLNLAAAVALVKVRAQAMAQAPAGGMSAVLGLDAAHIEAVLADFPQVWLANDNSPAQGVIAAEVGHLAAAEAALQAAGAKRVVRLGVGGAFHTPLQTGAAAAVTEWLGNHQLNDLNLPCWMNITAQSHIINEEIKNNLIAQTTGRVRWRQTMHHVAEAGITQVIELGCGKVLAGLAPRCDERLSAQSLSGTEELLRWVG
jgi:[acyl-carrier-protein] S-malonyltransferase